jgi:hypothetical protein
MARASQLKGTPWHTEVLRKDEDDPRRHKAWCKYYLHGYCISTMSGYLNKPCCTSVRCGWYTVKNKKQSDNVSVSKARRPGVCSIGGGTSKSTLKAPTRCDCVYNSDKNPNKCMIESRKRCFGPSGCSDFTYKSDLNF